MKRYSLGRIDHQAERLMEAAGYTQETVLAGGEVFISLNWKPINWWNAIDMTDSVILIIEMAVRAAKTIGLDVAGADFLTPDITRSYKEVGGICEVNAASGFMHLSPSEGEPRDVGKVIDMLFPPQSKSHIPIAAVTGTNGKTTTTRVLAHIHKMVGETVGMTTSDGFILMDRKR